jgi:hypothetical protein
VVAEQILLAGQISLAAAWPNRVLGLASLARGRGEAPSISMRSIDAHRSYRRILVTEEVRRQRLELAI